MRRSPHYYGSMLKTKSRSAARLQALRQPVTEHAEGDSNDDDGEPWEGRHPPRLADEIARLLNHGAPLRGGRLHTQAEKAERGAEQDVEHRVRHGKDNRRRDDIGQDVAANDPCRTVAKRFGGENILLILGNENLPSHQARVGNPADQSDTNEKVTQPGSEHGDDADDKDDEGESHDEVDDAHDNRVDLAAEIASDRPNNDPHHECDRGWHDT